MGAAFWIAYAFSIATILGQAAVDWFAFRNADTLRRVFMGIPIIKISFRCLCAQLAVGAALMTVATFVSFPARVAIVPCALILAFAAVAILKADWARDVIDQVDVKHQVNTSFMREFHAGLLALVPRAADAALRAKLEKLSEAAQYSDPVSAADLAALEAEMGSQLALLGQTVIADDADASADTADELSLLLNERNQKCRSMKQR